MFSANELKKKNSDTKIAYTNAGGSADDPGLHEVDPDRDPRDDPRDAAEGERQPSGPSRLLVALLQQAEEDHRGVHAEPSATSAAMSAMPVIMAISTIMSDALNAYSIQRACCVSAQAEVPLIPAPARAGDQQVRHRRHEQEGRDGRPERQRE